MDPGLSGTPHPEPTLPLRVPLTLSQPASAMGGGQAGARRLLLGQMGYSPTLPVRRCELGGGEG